MNWMDQFRAARRSAAPIIVIRTADYTSVIEEISKFYTDKNSPVLQWDICQGILGVNKLGVAAAKLVNKSEDGQPAAIVTGNPVEALQKSLALLAEDSILCMMNLQIILESKDDNRLTVIQGIWNCRDYFKSTGRTLVLLCPDLKVPPELSNDVVTLDVNLPTRQELEGIVTNQLKAAGLKSPEEAMIVKAVDAVSGLSEFSAEQVTAMSISREGLDLTGMWDRKKSIIRQAGGLSVYSGPGVSFDGLGGLEQIKAYLRLIIAGKRPPKLIVLLDEIEKQMAGTGGSTGIEMDAIGQLLTGMQDNGWGGILFPGFPGTGKTDCGKAMGCEAGGLFLNFDMGGMKDKFVGNSEKMIRAAIKMLQAMGGDRVFFIGTCNSMTALKPELKRRFTYGTYFFDLPTPEEQEPIWRIYSQFYRIPDQKLPSCVGWTGAEIKSCCDRADELGITLVKASEFISPVVKSMGEDVEKLRKSAHNKYLSASNEGYYNMAAAVTAEGIDEIRRIGKED